MKNVCNFSIFILFIIFTIIGDLFLNCTKNGIKTYKYYSYDEIIDTFNALKFNCSDFIKVTTAQELYKLNFPGKCGNESCVTPIIYMSDYTHKSFIKKQIFFSGLVHGDEVLGANVLTEIALYLCDVNSKRNNNIDDYKNVPIWIKKLLEENEIIFTPMTNSYGYYHKIREEYVNGKFLDPNREFPYFAELNKNKLSKMVSDECLITIASKTVNRLSIDNIFITGISFHGGTSVLGYPWGNFRHIYYKNGRQISTEAPDNKAFVLISDVLKSITSSNRVGGSLMKKIKNYEVGDMTSTVYAVDGGMEDWAYGGSWENEILKEKTIFSCENSEKLNSMYSNYDLSKLSNAEVMEYINLLKKIIDKSESSKNRDLLGLQTDENQIEETLFALNNKNKISKDENINENSDFNLEKLTKLIKNRENSLKMFFYLVEMSDDKIPNEDTLGNDENLFIYNSNDFYGHISRNIRLVFSMIDFNFSKIFIVEGNINSGGNVKLKLSLNGCLKLDKLLVRKSSFNINHSFSENFKNLLKQNMILYNKENIDCYWSLKQEFFNIDFSIPNDNISGFDLYFIDFSADEQFSFQESPDPKTSPKTHFVNLRKDKNYFVQNSNSQLFNENHSHPFFIFKENFLVIDDLRHTKLINILVSSLKNGGNIHLTYNFFKHEFTDINYKIMIKDSSGASIDQSKLNINGNLKIDIILDKFENYFSECTFSTKIQFEMTIDGISKEQLEHSFLNTDLILTLDLDGESNVNSNIQKCSSVPLFNKNKIEISIICNEKPDFIRNIFQKFIGSAIVMKSSNKIFSYTNISLEKDNELNGVILDESALCIEDIEAYNKFKLNSFNSEKIKENLIIRFLKKSNLEYYVYALNALTNEEISFELGGNEVILSKSQPIVNLLFNKKLLRYDNSINVIGDFIPLKIKINDKIKNSFCYMKKTQNYTDEKNYIEKYFNNINKDSNTSGLQEISEDSYNKIDINSNSEIDITNSRNCTSVMNANSTNSNINITNSICSGDSDSDSDSDSDDSSKNYLLYLLLIIFGCILVIIVIIMLIRRYALRKKYEDVSSIENNSIERPEIIDV